MPLHAFLLMLLLACGDKTSSDDDDDDDDGDDTSEAPYEEEPVGCANWDNWDCTPSAGGCVSTCEGSGSIICNPSGDCNYTGEQSGECPTLSGDECELCEAVVKQCMN